MGSRCRPGLSGAVALPRFPRHRSLSHRAGRRLVPTDGPDNHLPASACRVRGADSCDAQAGRLDTIVRGVTNACTEGLKARPRRSRGTPSASATRTACAPPSSSTAEGSNCTRYSREIHPHESRKRRQIFPVFRRLGRSLSFSCAGVRLPRMTGLRISMPRTVSMSVSWRMTGIPYGEDGQATRQSAARADHSS
jgi:hypothetical protein